MASLDYVGLTTLAAVFLTSLSVIVLLRPRRPLTDPPVPTVPFYKSAYFTMMMPYIPMDERFRRTLSHLSKDGTKIFQEWFGPVPVVTLTTAESAKVMFDYAKFPKLSLMRSLAVGESIASYLFGTNIVTAGGEEYLLHRSITRPAFARPYRLPVFVNCTRKLLTILRTHAQHHRDIPIDTYPFMQRLTLDVLGAAILSVDFGSLPESSSIPKDITNAHELKPGHFVDVWNALVANVFRPAYFFVPYYSKLPLPSVKRDWKVAKEFRGMMETIVEERIQQRRAANADGDYQNKKDMDLVDMMVEAGEAIIRDGSDRHPDKPQWTQEKMVHNLNMFFLAGHDTTANALSAAFYLIAKHPGAQVKLRDEVAGIFGKPNSVSDALFEADENAVRCKSSVSAVTSMRSSKRRCVCTRQSRFLPFVSQKKILFCAFHSAMGASRALRLRKEPVCARMFICFTEMKTSILTRMISNPSVGFPKRKRVLMMIRQMQKLQAGIRLREERESAWAFRCLSSSSVLSLP